MVDRPSKWQQTWNILSPYVTEPINAMQRLMTTPYEVLAGGPSPAFDQAVADSLALSGTVTGGSAMIPKPANAMAMGIKAFHGSPHSFDKFSMGKIGTGEGAQAYGHGLYFAENEGVARGYKEKLEYGGGFSAEDIAAQLMQANGSREGAILELQRRLDEITQRLKTNPDSVSPEFKTEDSKLSEDNRLSRALNYLENGGNPFGSMYEVDINADPNAFLDWDKALSEQPEVLAKLGKLDPTVTGEQLYKAINNRFDVVPAMSGFPALKGDPAQASKALKDVGIPGVKYLDAGSRGVGDGTRNYVVFDDRLISIVRKYGIAGASAYLGYDILKNVSEAQAEELRKIEKGVR